MQNIISLSIVDIPNHFFEPEGSTLRVMLWSGRLSAVPLDQVGELQSWASTNQNFFRALEELQRKALVFVDGAGLQVQGVNIKSNVPCWPVDERKTWRYSQKSPGGMSEVDDILRPFEHQGLALAPMNESLGGAKGFTRWTAMLYTLLPEIPLNEIKKRAYLLCVKNPNIFAAAQELKLGAEQRETEQGQILAGVHTDYPCWPKGL